MNYHQYFLNNFKISFSISYKAINHIRYPSVAKEKSFVQPFTSVQKLLNPVNTSYDKYYFQSQKNK